MSTQEVGGTEKAKRCLEANTPPRARTLRLFEAEVEGTRFDDRAPWTSDKPIYEKRPCIVYHAVDSSIQSKIDLLLGEGRFPAITSRPDEDEDDEEEEDGLGEEDSKKLDKLFLSIIREAKAKHLYREMYEKGQGCGTAIALLGDRNGRLFTETLDAKWATPERDANGELTKVVIQYPYIELQKVDGRWVHICYLYRREIDRESDTTFAKAEAREDGIDPQWTVATKTQHGLGFVPVKWYKHRAPRQHIASEDGNPVHRTLLSELEEMDYSLSQRHHGALHALPQIVEIGVEPGTNPTAVGKTQMTVDTTESGGTPNPVTNPVRGQYRTVSTAVKGTRKKGPNHIWQYESPDTKVEAINTPGDALKSIDDDVKDLRNKICETLAWVPLDPDSIKFAATVSGKALEILRERELNRVCQDREVFGEDVILGVICMLLRIALKRSAQLRTPRLKQCLPILQKFVGTDEQWQDPLLTLRWPPFFRQDPENQKFTSDMARADYEGGVITRRTQVQAVASIYGITNIDAYLEELEEENEKKRQQAQEDMAQSMAKFHDDSELDDSDGEGKSRGGKPEANPPGGAGGAGPAAGDPAKAKAANAG